MGGRQDEQEDGCEVGVWRCGVTRGSSQSREVLPPSTWSSTMKTLDPLLVLCLWCVCGGRRERKGNRERDINLATQLCINLKYKEKSQNVDVRVQRVSAMSTTGFASTVSPFACSTLVALSVEGV